MYFHSRVSPSAVGLHQPGVNTFGGQESMASKSDSSLLPNLILWKTADELWARQVLKLASQNWLDERVHSVMGLNGKWEFNKLKGDALDLDKIRIVTRVLPIDPSQQDAMAQAVAAGALDPQDPRVKRKMMELFHLPIEMDSLYTDQKVQWKEIETMKQTGQQIQPVMIRDNDMVHIDICRNYLNSDEASDNPQMAQIVLQHAQLHIINMARQAQMQAVVQGAGQAAAQATGAGPQPGQEQGGQLQGKQPEGQKKPGDQSGKHGGQSPTNPITRQQRAQKGQAARPKGQPSSGNQYHQRQQT
jgi:hypothetical protein